ncbi:COG4 transport protein-domain-containing protein [Terfezia claveryi]|nr:COG4 transport protein-domain-containing protein [Terfezia claveryi]
MALQSIRVPQELDPPWVPLPASQCRTVADLEHTLAVLSKQEDAITDRLDTLLETQEELNRSLSRLDLLRAHLGTQVVAARSLSNEMLSPTSNTAFRVSSAVQALDIEQARVKATLEVVEQVVELKACVLGVTGSMGAPQDWETAAAYLHRASKVPKEILEGEFAEEMVPTTEVPDPPKVTLHNAAESLCGLFLREFEKAAGMNPPDGEKITRFFKLFPLIGRAETGLDVYGKYVCTGISSRARAVLANKPEGGAAGAGAFFYANAITRLFEHIAGIVEQHSPLVERHYGKGKMGRVIARVQREADLQGGIILDAWGEERQVDRRLTETKSYAFTFLVQSFLPNARNTGVPGRTASPAAGSAGGGQMAQGECEGGDVKEVDMILLEIGAMLSRWSLYCRFMARKSQESEDPSAAAAEPPRLTLPSVISTSSLSTKISSRLLNPFLTLTTFFIRRTVETAFQLDEPPSDLLPLPIFHSASHHTTYSPPPSPFITSAVDDVMFIVNKLLHRSLHTSQKQLVVGVLATVSRVLGSDFIGVIQRRMRDECYPRPAVQTTTIIVGNPAASLAQSMANVVDDRSVTFMVLVNNLDIAAEYCKRIVNSYITAATSSPEQASGGVDPHQQAAYGDDSAPPTSLELLFPFPNENQEVIAALNTLESAFTQKASEVASDAVLTLFNQLIKAKLRPLITEAFRDVDYSTTTSITTTAIPLTSANILSEPPPPQSNSSSSHDADDDLVKSRFELGFTSLIQPFKYTLTDTPFTKLLAHTATYLSRLLEKKIIQLGGGISSSNYPSNAYPSSSDSGGQISELGAIRLDRDVSGIINVVVKAGRYGVREAFARCVQICLVLGVDEEEVGGLYDEGDGDGDGGPNGGGMGVEWKLSVDERRRVRGMVIRR